MSRILPPHLAAQLKAMGQSYAIETLSLDSDGAVVLCFDDGVTLHLACTDPLEDLSLYCDVGVLPACPDPRLLTELLQFNQLDEETCGAVVGLTQDDAPRVLARLWIPWRRLTVEEFVLEVEAFVALLDDLDALCRESASSPPPPLAGMALRG